MKNLALIIIASSWFSPLSAATSVSTTDRVKIAKIFNTGGVPRTLQAVSAVCGHFYEVRKLRGKGSDQQEGWCLITNSRVTIEVREAGGTDCQGVLESLMTHVSGNLWEAEAWQQFTPEGMSCDSVN